MGQFLNLGNTADFNDPQGSLLLSYRFSDASAVGGTGVSNTSLAADGNTPTDGYIVLNAASPAIDDLVFTIGGFLWGFNALPRHHRYFGLQICKCRHRRVPVVINPVSDTPALAVSSEVLEGGSIFFF